MTTATETSDIEALLTVISKEDIEGEIAQLRAAVNVLARNPKPSIAENAKSLVESVSKKAKNITAHAVLAHKTLDQLEKTCEAKANAARATEQQKWTAQITQLKDQLTMCNRELQRSRTSAPRTGPAQRPTQPFIEPDNTPPPRDQKLAAREAIRNAWSSIQPRLARLLKAPYQTTLQELKQTLPLDRLGIPPQIQEQIYRITLARLIYEGNRWRANGSPIGIYEYTYNVYRAMMEAATF